MSSRTNAMKRRLTLQIETPSKTSPFPHSCTTNSSSSNTSPGPSSTFSETSTSLLMPTTLTNSRIPVTLRNGLSDRYKTTPFSSSWITMIPNRGGTSPLYELGLGRAGFVAKSGPEILGLGWDVMGVIGLGLGYVDVGIGDFGVELGNLRLGLQ